LASLVLKRWDNPQLLLRLALSANVNYVIY
jgi:hypothetical protein